MGDANLDRVLTFSETMVKSDTRWWPFNSILFINYDVNHTVQINTDIIVPAAQAIATGVVPGKFSIDLKTRAYNDTTFKVLFVKNSTTNKLVIVYTQYVTGTVQHKEG